jgi:hypothetical protein
MTVVFDEPADLLLSLLFSVKTIIGSGPQGKQHIAKNYRNARSLMATIDRDRGSLGPRIEVCLKQFHAYKKAGDAASAGWMLAAIQERVSERNLYGWRRLGQIVDTAVQELLLFE